MKRSYFDEISNLYSEKVLVSEQTLNESMPPYEVGPTPSGPYKKYDPDDYLAFTQPQYAGPTKGISERPDFGDVIVPNILKAVGADIIQAIKGSGGQLPDNRDAMNRRAGDAIMRLVKAGSKPLFTSRSHAYHLGRNVVQALIDAGHLKEITTKGGSKKGSQKFTGDITFGSDEPEEPPA